MTDKEKLALIDSMIADLWEMNTLEEREQGASCLIVSISSVINFKGEE